MTELRSHAAVLKGCPDGMYPTGTEEITYQNEACDLNDLREQVEPMLGTLNVPIGWWFNDPDLDPDVDERYFEIVLWMPRKMKTWSVRVTDFNRDEVQGWLDDTIKAAVMHWFGWQPHF